MLVRASKTLPDASRGYDPDEVLDAGLRVQDRELLLVEGLHNGLVRVRVLCQSRDGRLIAEGHTVSSVTMSQCHSPVALFDIHIIRFPWARAYVQCASPLQRGSFVSYHPGYCISLS